MKYTPAGRQVFFFSMDGLFIVRGSPLSAAAEERAAVFVSLMTLLLDIEGDFRYRFGGIALVYNFHAGYMPAYKLILISVMLLGGSQPSLYSYYFFVFSGDFHLTH